MATRAVIVLIALAAVSITGCDYGMPPGPSAAEQVAMWKSGALDNARDDVELAVGLNGTVATVSARSLADAALCTSEATWPDGEMLGDVFLVKAGGRYRRYTGNVASVMGDDSMTLLPGQVLTGQVDLARFYDLPRGGEIESVEFSTAFYNCPSNGAPA